MSDLNQIHTVLERFFNEEGQRIVFWNDPDQEFFMTVPLLGEKVECRLNPGHALAMFAGRRTRQPERGFSSMSRPNQGEVAFAESNSFIGRQSE